MDRFTQDIEERSDITESLTSKEDIKSYNDTMDSVLNDHATLKMKNIKIVPNASRFDCGYDRMRKLRRKAGRQYIRTRLVVDKEN